MADRLSKVYGTQMDKVNCPFFYKIGACRYGDSCQRIHNKPPISQTVMLEHLYSNNPIETALISGNQVSREDAQRAMQKVQKFYQEVFTAMSQYGQIEDMIIVDNLGDHIAGNVYVKYTEQQYAENAFKKVNGRFQDGKKIKAQFSPVTDFLNAKCKQYMDGSCKRGGYCNYMHIKPLSKSFKRELFQKMYLQHPEYKIKKQSDNESDSGDWKRKDRDRKDRRDNKYDRDRRDKDKNRKRSRSRDRSRQKRHRDKDRDRKNRKRQSSEDSGSQERRNMIDKWNAQNY